MSSGPRVYLHIGEPKTGSTYLQQVMWRNRAALARSGVMLPGPRPLAHWRAAQDLRGVPQPANDPIGPNAGAWDRLVRQALRAPRTSVISHELLAAADEGQARRAVASFGEAEVHLIVAVRDFASLLPAEWQETVKHRNTREWPDWLADVIDRESVSPDRRQFWFWRVHDTLEILRGWSARLPDERVHVITVPPRGSEPDLLWRRFAGVIGADHEGIDLAVAPSNASLGLAAVELLRRVNVALPEELPDWFYMRTVKDVVVADALTKVTDPERLELPHERFPWAAEQSQRLATGLAASGFDIVGDLADLTPCPSSGSRSPADVGDDELLPHAIEVVRVLLTGAAAGQGVPARPAPPERQPPRAVSIPKQLAISASRRSAMLHRARRGYWHAANAVRRVRARRDTQVWR